MRARREAEVVQRDLPRAPPRTLSGPRQLQAPQGRGGGRAPPAWRARPPQARRPRRPPTGALRRAPPPPRGARGSRATMQASTRPWRAARQLSRPPRRETHLQPLAVHLHHGAPAQQREQRLRHRHAPVPRFRRRPALAPARQRARALRGTAPRGGGRGGAEWESHVLFWAAGGGSASTACRAPRVSCVGAAGAKAGASSAACSARARARARACSSTLTRTLDTDTSTPPHPHPRRPSACAPAARAVRRLRCSRDGCRRAWGARARGAAASEISNGSNGCGARRGACPVSTEGGTRRVQLVREGGGGA